MQNKLVPTAATILLQLQFAHWKMIFQQVFFATERDMHKMSQMVQRANLSGCFGKMWSSNRLTHAETALTEKLGEFSESADLIKQGSLENLRPPPVAVISDGVFLALPNSFAPLHSPHERFEPNHLPNRNGR